MGENKGVSEAATILQKANSVVAFTGAGISTASGIPDFRSPDSGLWDNVNPMIVGSIFGFRLNPQAFYDWVYPLTKLTSKAQPNPAHISLARLENKGKLQAIITQNIDMLHNQAGNQTVYELHGHMREATCLECGSIFNGEPIIRQFLQDHQVPHCQKCNGVLKPNVVLFGEELPMDIFEQAQDATKNSDVMIVIGSSLEVSPANEFPILAKQNKAKVIIINKEQTHLDYLADVVIYGDAAKILPQIMQQMEK